MFKPFIAVLLIFVVSSSLIQLDKQLVPVNDLTSYSFKVMIQNKIHNFYVQTFKSSGGYLT